MFDLSKTVPELEATTLKELKELCIENGDLKSYKLRRMFSQIASKFIKEYNKEITYETKIVECFETSKDNRGNRIEKILMDAFNEAGIPTTDRETKNRRIGDLIANGLNIEVKSSNRHTADRKFALCGVRPNYNVDYYIGIHYEEGKIYYVIFSSDIIKYYKTRDIETYNYDYDFKYSDPLNPIKTMKTKKRELMSYRYCKSFETFTDFISEFKTVSITPPEEYQTITNTIIGEGFAL